MAVWQDLTLQLIHDLSHRRLEKHRAAVSTEALNWSEAHVIGKIRSAFSHANAPRRSLKVLVASHFVTKKTLRLPPVVVD